MSLPTCTRSLFLVFKDMPAIDMIVEARPARRLVQNFSDATTSAIVAVVEVAGTKVGAIKDVTMLSGDERTSTISIAEK